MLEKCKISSLNTQSFAVENVGGMWTPTCPVQVSSLPCPGQRVFLEVPCSGQDTGQISRNTRCPGEGRLETWTGQVGVHMPPTFSTAKLCILTEEILDFSNIFYGNNNHCTWRYEILNEFAICVCDQATYTHKNIREKEQ